MIKAVIFDMFETLVSMFSGGTYYSEDMATDLNIPVDAFRNERISEDTTRHQLDGIQRMFEKIIKGI